MMIKGFVGGLDLKSILNISVIFNLLFLFFGSVSVGFSVIGQTHYAIICIVVATLLLFFKKMNEAVMDEVIFSFEMLSKMVTFGLAPMVLLVSVTSGNFLAVFIGSFYILACAIRITYLNFENEDSEDKQQGLPLFSVAMVLPILSLISWILGDNERTILWNLIFLVLLVAFVIPKKLPRIPAKFQFALLAVGILLIAILLLQGPL